MGWHNRFGPTLLIVLLTSAISMNAPSHAEAQYGATPADIVPQLKRMSEVYSEFIEKFDEKDVILRDGTRIKISDGRTDKSFDDLLNNPDFGDMFVFAYPIGTKPSPPAQDFDPGRIRVESLFKKMYGDCKKKGAVESKLKEIDWMPQTGGGKISFTTANGAAKALQQVSFELDKLPSQFKKFLLPLAGSFNCRVIANTERRSMHAYGAAIDINVDHSAYWLWDQMRNKLGWRNEIPMEIVDVFERHGFIWGGRWNHYDTMHFEFRPEFGNVSLNQ